MVIAFEDDVTKCVGDWLSNRGWKILEMNLGHKHGPDILARKGGNRIIVESKGSKGNPKSPVTTRKRFDSGQIKDHFGKAIVKVLEERYKDPNAIVAIAHPDDEYIRKVLNDAAEEVRKMGIILFWVKSSDEMRVQSDSSWARKGLPEFAVEKKSHYCSV